MKSRWILGVFVMVVFFCGGIAFAETMDKVESVQATAEDAVKDDEAVTDAMTSEDSMAADELYMPADEMTKPETTAGVEETPKM